MSLGTNQPWVHAAQPCERRDELAEQRARRMLVPEQRPPAALPEPDREDYELRIDAYEVQLADYRARLAEYASQLEAAHHDGLTGTWLRHAGRQLLDEELARAARLRTPLSIAFVDVDGLKARNDRHGHAAGDAALVTVAGVLVAGLRSYDSVVRWGGDEFLCVLPGLTAMEADRRLEQCRAVLGSSGGQLTISVGIAARRVGDSPEGLVARADRALYRFRGSRPARS
jgi:diguanylate cyclase (GGDEF)-like protein